MTMTARPAAKRCQRCGEGYLRFDGEEWGCYKCSYRDHRLPIPVRKNSASLTVLRVRYDGPALHLKNHLTFVHSQYGRAETSTLSVRCPFECGLEMTFVSDSGHPDSRRNYWSFRCPAKHRIRMRRDLISWR